MVNIGTSMFFAEISGSAVADVAAMGSILIPAMKKKGYPKEFAAAITSSSATLAVIIPPSIPMILYAVMADTSVVQLFVAGIVPGILGGGAMMALCYWFAKRYNYPVEEVFQWAKVRRTFKEAAWALPLPLIILGGIFGGVVTATEGAALAVLAALFIGGVIYRELNWKHLYDGDDRRRDADRHRDAAGRRVGAARRLPDRAADAAAAGDLAIVGITEQPLRGAGDPQRLLPASSACSCTRRRPSSWSCRS